MRHLRSWAAGLRGVEAPAVDGRVRGQAGQVACPHCEPGVADWPVGLWSDGGPFLCSRCGGITDRRGAAWRVDVQDLLVPGAGSRTAGGPAPGKRARDTDRAQLAACPELSDYLGIVQERLSGPAAFEARFVDAGEPRVSAVPPAGVVLSLGLLAQLEDEAQLAFVLARENALIDEGLVARRFTAARARGEAGGRLGRPRRISQSVDGALEVSWRLGYGQEWEVRADLRGVRAMRAAGYDPAAAAATLERLESASLAGGGGRFLVAGERREMLLEAAHAPGPFGRLNREVYRRVVGGFRVFLHQH
jgi:hypothetical protein